MKEFIELAYQKLLKGQLDEAASLYEKAPLTNAKKWGFFVCDFLKDPMRNLPGPGFLTFRLFFETTMRDFVKHNRNDYFECFANQIHNLNVLYPDAEKELKKLLSEYPPNDLGAC
ncbi:MAG: hypothetical protein LW817_08070 [Candidatus Caenarcaniphilales bacterium]|jgi:hypothetical protein|nr:hypothetical protein [Candidatus Caenarcaniphilales bacterium]